MGTLGTAVIKPAVTTGQFGILFGAEDNTSGTAFTTSDQSGYAHVGYGRVNVVSGTTIGGTAYGTANRNDWGYVATSGRILNLFPNDSLTAISIRRGRTRPDQYDDVGECTVTVLNTTGASDPDNATGRYQRLSTPTAGTGTTVLAAYSSWLQPGMYGQVMWGGAGGTQIPLFTGVLEQVEPTDDRVSTATYTFVDRIALLGRASTAGNVSVGAKDDIGSVRIKDICAAARVSDIINLNGGTNTIEQLMNVRGFNRRVNVTRLGDSALDSLKTIVNGEAGRIFCGRDGLVNVWDRAYMQTQGTTMAGTFTDTPATVAGFGYDEIQTNQAQNFVYNSAVVTAGSTISATAQSVDSVAQYGQRNYEVEAALSSAGDAVALATFLATEWATPSTNVASLSVQAFAFTQANFDTLARIELQQGIRVYRRLPGGRTLDVNCVVEGIEIDITPSTRRFTFYLSPRDTVSLSWPS